MKKNKIGKIIPRKKSYGTFGMKKNGHKTPNRIIGSFDVFSMLRSNIHDLDLIINNNPNMSALSILKEDLIEKLNFKKK